VTARLTTWDAPAPPDRAAIDARFRQHGLSPHGWGNAPGDTYGRHAHEYDKVLYCVSGGITFHTDAGDFDLEPGDRLDVDAGTAHSATVGPDGVECMEASR
jgi:quercetin dioxygenase-like cupin family protein